MQQALNPVESSIRRARLDSLTRPVSAAPVSATAGGRRVIARALVALLLAGAVMPALAADSGGLISPKDAPALYMLYTGDVIGYLDTCGCKRNPAGGLARREWVRKKVEETFPDVPLMLFDSGNFSDNPTPAGDVKTRALVEAMGTMGYLAANVAERDLRTGYDDFVSRIGEPAFPLVSTNIVVEETGEPVFEPSLMLEVESATKKKIKVGVVGAVRYNPVFLKAGPDDTNMVIEKPIERLAPEVAKLKKEGAHVVVLLAALHKEEARRIVEEIQDINFVFAAYAGQVTNAGEDIGRSTVIFSGNQGKRLGETRVYLDQYGFVKRHATRMHFLTSAYPIDQPMLDWVNAVEIPESPTPTVGGGQP